MTGSNILARLQQHVRQRGRLWLFMDYDGTLVPIAPTSDQARPDPRLLALLASLAQVPAFRTAIVSGRSLASLQSLLPIPGLILAGVYGLEVQMAGRAIVRGQVRQEVRPAVAYVKARWAELVAGRDGFLIEDKDRAVALHARWAAAGE